MHRCCSSTPGRVWRGLLLGVLELLLFGAAVVLSEDPALQSVCRYKFLGSSHDPLSWLAVPSRWWSRTLAILGTEERRLLQAVGELKELAGGPENKSPEPEFFQPETLDTHP